MPTIRRHIQNLMIGGPSIPLSPVPLPERIRHSACSNNEMRIGILLKRSTFVIVRVFASALPIILRAPNATPASPFGTQSPMMMLWRLSGCWKHGSISVAQELINMTEQERLEVLLISAQDQLWSTADSKINEIRSIAQNPTNEPMILFMANAMMSFLHSRRYWAAKGLPPEGP